eukprot:Rhum_TRINITY_DN12510_c0_g1::Rhum_TRINITY_DN12510_c0_g1_i1::g.52512::m.52512
MPVGTHVLCGVAPPCREGLAADDGTGTQRARGDDRLRDHTHEEAVGAEGRLALHGGMRASLVLHALVVRVVVDAARLPRPVAVLRHLRGDAHARPRVDEVAACADAAGRQRHLDGVRHREADVRVLELEDGVRAHPGLQRRAARDDAEGGAAVLVHLRRADRRVVSAGPVARRARCGAVALDLVHAHVPALEAVARRGLKQAVVRARRAAVPLGLQHGAVASQDAVRAARSVAHAPRAPVRHVAVKGTQLRVPCAVRRRERQVAQLRRHHGELRRLQRRGRRNGRRRHRCRRRLRVYVQRDGGCVLRDVVPESSRPRRARDRQRHLRGVVEVHGVRLHRQRVEHCDATVQLHSMLRREHRCVACRYLARSVQLDRCHACRQNGLHRHRAEVDPNVRNQGPGRVRDGVGRHDDGGGVEGGVAPDDVHLAVVLGHIHGAGRAHPRCGGHGGACVGHQVLAGHPPELLARCERHVRVGAAGAVHGGVRRVVRQSLEVVVPKDQEGACGALADDGAGLAVEHAVRTDNDIPHLHGERAHRRGKHRPVARKRQAVCAEGIGFLLAVAVLLEVRRRGSVCAQQHQTRHQPDAAVEHRSRAHPMKYRYCSF